MSWADPFGWVEECRPTRRHLRRRAMRTAIACGMVLLAIVAILIALRGFQ